MKKLSPTRGVYDLAGVEGAAGPVQFFGALACLATVIVAAVTFRHGPFSLYSVTFLLIAHGFSRTVRMRVPSVERRLALSGVMLVALLALTLAVPPLRDAAITPDMRQDRDYALGGILMWIALAGQTFASAPGVLIFLLLPELASMAVFGQLNVNVEMPASFALYLASALGLLAYANFLRRPLGAPVERSVVLPGVRDMMFSISTLFLLLALGGGFLAIVLQAIIPSAFARPWLTGYFFQSDRSSRGAYDDFANELDLGVPGSNLQTAPVLSVTGANPMLLRRRVYQRYTGDGWLPNPRPPRRWWRQGSQSVASGQVPGRPVVGVELDHAVLLHVPMRGAVPVAGIPYDLTVPSHLTMVVDMDGVVAVTGGLDAGMTIGVQSIECPGDLPILDESTAAYPLWAIESDYLQVPPQALPLMSLALQITEGERSVIGKARAIERFLEMEYVYNLDATPPDPEADAVTDFLSRRREGICTDFASAMAILCRLVGIPTRLVTGYMAAEPDPLRPGYLLSREKDAHAWVEVLVPAAGWVTFDPQAEREASGSSLTRFMQQMERWWTGVSRMINTNLLLIALLIPLAYIVVYQTRKHGPALGRGEGGAGTGLRSLVRGLQLVAGWRSPGTTPREYVEAARGSLPDETWQEASDLVTELTATCYRREEPDAAELRSVLWRVRGLVWRLRKIATARWLRSLRPRKRAAGQDS